MPRAISKHAYAAEESERLTDKAVFLCPPWSKITVIFGKHQSEIQLQVFDLTKQQEITKAQELKTEEAKHLAYQAQHASVSHPCRPLSLTLVPLPIMLHIEIQGSMQTANVPNPSSKAAVS